MFDVLHFLFLYNDVVFLLVQKSGYFIIKLQPPIEVWLFFSLTIGDQIDQT